MFVHHVSLALLVSRAIRSCQVINVVPDKMADSILYKVHLDADRIQLGRR